jgi:Mg2+-importing ATPase
VAEQTGGREEGSPFWQTGPAELMARLGTTASGLSPAEAAARLTAVGPNVVSVSARRRILAKVLKRLAEPLIAILILAAAIAGLTGDLASFAIILVIVALSIGLDVTQEHRAEETAEALRRSVAVRTDVVRDGRTDSIPVEDLVPGDIVRLRAGDLVPADGVVLDGASAHVNEALLTGEPYPVEKRPGPSTAETPGDAFDALFGGTSMVSGEATMLVVATGPRSRFGGIAAALAGQEPPTAFERSLHQLGLLIVRLTAFLVLLVLLAHLAFHRPVLESFLFAVALAVGLTPELLPMVVTVTLSRGALRMASRRVVVKRLAAIHDLGSMDVLCTDKTGTLTEARIALVAHPGPDGVDSPAVLALAAVNSRFETGVKSPLDDAILAAAPEPEAGWTRIADVPFDFERRRVSVLAERAGRRLLIVKGAAEEVLSRCVASGLPDVAPKPLDAAGRQALEQLHDGQAVEGLRCLAVAWREMPAGKDRPEVGDEHDLVFAGLCAFLDPAKASAADAIARLEATGVRVKIISGDAAPVMRHLVTSLGLPAHGLLTGAEIAHLSDLALAGQVDGVDLFARVSPDQKTRIIRALQARGHVVGFIGDGINDAPAIKAADCGLSVEGAADVARAAADMIMLTPDLGVVADGVAEGRRTYANIMKYVRMGTSSNFGNMLSMAVASLFIPFLPLTPVQVLVNNLLYDVSETGIPFDRVDPAEIVAPRPFAMRDVLRFTLVMGPLSSLFDIATFTILLAVFGLPADGFRTGWFVESIATQILVIFVIRTAGLPWSSRPHVALTATSLCALAAGLGLALSPWAPALGFGPVPAAALAVLGGLVVAYLVLAQVAKRWAFPPLR